ncbi:ParD-like family protein [Marivita sp.]|uniref:ParD-like family protein n=1 Tax=Marivita sp. TaxID=2003365 RepID=UPI003F6E44EA
MGIVKIGDDLHEELRKSSSVMCRSINAQAEFWIKVGMVAEANPPRDRLGFRQPDEA